MTHYFKITAEAMRTIKDNDKRIVRIKRIPKEGDTLLFEDTEGVQKELHVKEVDAERAGLMKNYYLIEYETKK